MAAKCCLHCGFQELGLDCTLVNYAIRASISVSEILAMKHFFTKSLLLQMEESKRNVIIGLCKSLIEVHGHAYAPLFHPGYFYQSTYSVTTTFNGQQVVLGQVKSGQILEILMDDTSESLAESIIDGMKKRCGEVIMANKVSPKLWNFVFNKVLRISLQKQQLEVTHNDEVSEVIKLYRCNRSANDLFRELLYHLEKIESVSLLVVDYMHESPLVMEWIRFFCSIYGGLYTQTCVFVLRLPSTQSATEVKQRVNFDLDLDIDLKWLDLSSLKEIPPPIEMVDPFLLQHADN